MSRPALAETVETTRDRLIAVALQLFRQYGYEGTSLGAVAEQLRISAPAVYYHFRSKDELLYATQEAYTQQMLDELERAAAQGTPAERLRAFAYTHARAQLETVLPGRGHHAFGFVQLLRSLEGERRERLKRLGRRVLDLLREIIRQGVADGSFDQVNATAAAFAIIGMDHHLVHWFSAEGDLAVHDLATVQADFALRLVGGAAGRPRGARQARRRPARHGGAAQER